MPKKEDLTGKIFNLIEIVSPAPSKSGKTYWNCKCIKCGAEKIIQTSHIKNGAIKTCGCGCSLDNIDNNEEEKVCEICGNKFILKRFATNRKYCYECSPSYIDRQSRVDSINTLRKAMKKKAIELKGGKCERCGYNKCMAALQFHHRNPEEKKFGLASGGKLHSWEDYLEEVNKCILLCANCHAEEHFLQDIV